MKKQLVASIIGIGISAATISSSFGQGTIWFSTYISSVVHAPVVFWAGRPVTAADGVYAELYYGIGSGLSFGQLTPLPASITQVGVLLPGAIVGPVMTIPVYTAGPITFGIAVFTVSGGLCGMSGTWTEPSIAVIPQPAGIFTASLLDAACPGGISFYLTPPPPPMAANVTAATGQDRPLTLDTAKLLALAYGSLNAAVTGVSGASTNGGSVVLEPRQITYTPPAGYTGADRFSYTLSVPPCGTSSASAFVFVQVLATNQISANMLPLSATPGGYMVSFAGIPGRTYSVQRAPAVTGPWVTIATVTVDTSGIGGIQDTNALEGAAFYRTTYP